MDMTYNGMKRPTCVKREKQIILAILRTWQFLTMYSLGGHSVHFKRKPKAIPHGKTTNYYELSIVHCSSTLWDKISHDCCSLALRILLIFLEFAQKINEFS